MKRKNVIKLITNSGHNLSGKKLIEEARKVIGSDFIYLLFAMSKDHFDWVKNMTNLFLTNNTRIFSKIAALNIYDKRMLEFIDELEKFHKVKFNIVQDQMLNFPNIIE